MRSCWAWLVVDELPLLLPRDPSSDFSVLVAFFSLDLAFLPVPFSPETILLSVDPTFELAPELDLLEPDVFALPADFDSGLDGLALSLHAEVLGPFLPGGAPPGSGTQAERSEGSVSLTPGWFLPRKA